MKNDAVAIRRDEIQDVLASFFSHIDMMELDLIGALFEQDAHYTVCLSRQDRAQRNLSVNVSNRDEIVGYISRSISALEQTHHMFGNLTSTVVEERIKASAHIRAYHKGKGALAHLFEESLAIADFEMRLNNSRLRISRLDYTVLIILGSMDVFSAQ
jgi:hypothetical protein